MNKLYLLAVPAISMALSSCTSNDKDLFNQNAVDELEYSKVVPNVDIANVSQFKMTKEYTLPTQAGKVTVLTQGNDTLAISDHAVSVNIPKTATVVESSAVKKVRRAASNDSIDSNENIEKGVSAIKVQYVDAASLPSYKANTSYTEESFVLMFEDRPIKCDYDYNDVVLAVKCEINKDADGKQIISVAVKPLAFSGSYNVKFGFDYGATDAQGNTPGIELSENVKKDFFGDKTVNTDGTYTSVISLKNYTLKNQFAPTTSTFSSGKEYMKFDRKSYQTLDEKGDTATITIGNDGFYQFAPIEFDNGKITDINFYIEPEIPLTYTKTSTITVNGKELTGKVKYTSTFSYKLYAGDCNAKESTNIPYGIQIPVSALKDDKNSEASDNDIYIYWPCETQPIWAGLTAFQKWLDGADNTGAWINTFNENATFNTGTQSWNANLVMKGASKSTMTLPSVAEYTKYLETMKATNATIEKAKITETVKNKVEEN